MKKRVKAKKVIKAPAVVKLEPAAKSPWKISPELLAWSKRDRRSRGQLMLTPTELFMVAKPPPGVLPKDTKLAMDDAITSSIAWGQNQLGNVWINQGYTFLGYAYLAELAQIPEYRLISSVIATEMTRKWIKIQSASEDAGQSERIEQLTKELDRLGVRDAFRTLAEQDGFFGRTHLYIDTGDTDARDELKTPLFSEDEKVGITSRKLKKGDLRALKTIEPVWCYPANYDANDPLKDQWYNPDQWFVMGKQLHKTRLLTFVARPVPDMLKPAFSFGGLSLTQMAKPYVDNWLRTRQSVNDLIHAFSVMILKTDLQTMLQGGSPDLLQDRADLFNNLRDNLGLMMVNKDSEDFANVSVPLGTLDKLQAQAQEHICSVSRMPLVKYTGLSPTGLNASSDGEIRVFYDTIHAEQENFFRPHLTTVIALAQINLWGTTDPDLTFIFEPLWEMDDEALARVRKSDADMATAYVDGGVLHPEEIRQAIHDDPTSPFNSIDVSDVPEPPAEEGMEGDLTEEDDGGAKETTAAA